MATLLPPASSPATSTSSMTSSSPNPNHPALPPLITSSPSPNRRPTMPRPTSHASKSRLSQYSTQSGPRSRPPSHIFPAFHSSLAYTLVRDFAYPSTHPLHYGVPPEPSRPPSGLSTPVSDAPKRLSDPPTSWDSRNSRPGEGLGKGEQLAPVHFGDGPPWSEDEDLQSPVVVSSRHRKHKSTSGAFSSNGPPRSRPRDPKNFHDAAYEQGPEAQRFYVDDGGEAGGPGGEYVSYPARQSTLAAYNLPGQRDSHFATGSLPRRSYAKGEQPPCDDESGASSQASSPGWVDDESRYSRDYQFTITSPDEEMHGKAVALFDFARENENELPLVEGQIIWVSYRHGQGWLVAEDPKTQESGLVPEEYVRLLRDIQGGWNSLTGQPHDAAPSPVPQDVGTPTQAEHSHSLPTAAAASNGTNGYQQPVVSTFSTSSKDLRPYPQHLLGTQAGQAPPQVVHYNPPRGSQTNTPTAATPQDADVRMSDGDDEDDVSAPAALSSDVHVPDTKTSHPSPDGNADDDDSSDDDDDK